MSGSPGDRLRAPSPVRAAARQATTPTTPTAVHSLQRTVGNRAVGQLLSRTPRDIPLEFIAASTQAASSEGFSPNIQSGQRGQMPLGSSAIAEMRASGWRTHFVDAARRVAEHEAILAPLRNTLDPQHFGRSANLLRTPPAARAALLFENHDFPGTRHDLDDTRDYTAETGELTVALRHDYGAQLTIRRQVTRRQVINAIRAATHAIGARVGAGQYGELLIDFQGHGINATEFWCVDDTNFDETDLFRLWVQASRANVRLVVVSEVCFQGAGVLLADQLGLSELEDDADRAGRAHETALSSQFLAAHTLLGVTQAVGNLPTALDNALDECENARPAPTAAQFAAVDGARRNLITALRPERHALGHGVHHNRSIDLTTADAFDDVWRGLQSPFTPPVAGGRAWQDQLGQALHLLYTNLADLLEQIDRELNTPAPAPVATSTPPPTTSAGLPPPTTSAGPPPAGTANTGSMDAGVGPFPTGMDAGI